MLSLGISQDVSLTYKLLSYINSAMYSLSRQITSISHAVMLVGQQKIRAWASLIVLATVDDKSRDLVTTGAVRARATCARALELPKPERSFLVGLLSVLDALLDQPMTEVVQSLPLEWDILEAVVSHQGPLGNVLDLRPGIRETHWAEAGGSQIRARDPRSDQKSLAWSLSTLNSFTKSEPAKAPGSSFSNPQLPRSSDPYPC